MDKTKNQKTYAYEQVLEAAKQYGNFMWWFEKNASVSVDWSTTAGYNIRKVLPGAGPEVGRFEVKSDQHYRGLCNMFKNHDSFYESLVKFRRPLAGYVASENELRHGRTLLDTVPPLPASISDYLLGTDLYETMFQPELVWMVDNQLPACSWMTVKNARQVSTGSSCDLNYKCHATSIRPCSSPPIPMAPFRVLSYDIEAVPYVNPETGECEFPDPKRDSIVTIGVAAFDMVSTEMKQTVFMLEIKGQPPLPTTL